MHKVPRIVHAVPTYRRPAELRELLASIAAQEHPEMTAVAICDNDGDNDKESLHSYPFTVSYRQHPSNIGPSANLMAAISDALSMDPDYVWIMGDDDRLTPDAHHTLRQVIEKQAPAFIFTPAITMGSGHQFWKGVPEGILSAEDSARWIAPIAGIMSCHVYKADVLRTLLSRPDVQSQIREYPDWPHIVLTLHALQEQGGGYYCYSHMVDFRPGNDARWRTTQRSIDVNNLLIELAAKNIPSPGLVHEMIDNFASIHIIPHFHKKIEGKELYARQLGELARKYNIPPRTMILWKVKEIAHRIGGTGCIRSVARSVLKRMK